jgi:hypothetical protein
MEAVEVNTSTLNQMKHNWLQALNFNRVQREFQWDFISSFI